MNKRGASKVVEAVLIILVVIAAISLLWWAVFAFLSGETLYIEDPTVQIKIIKSDFTAYDKDKGLLILHTSRGADTAHVVGLRFIFTYGCGNTFEHIQYPALEPNSRYVYEYIVANYSDLIEVSIAPIFSFLGNNISSKFAKNINKLPPKNLSFSSTHTPIGKKTKIFNLKNYSSYAGRPRHSDSDWMIYTFDVFFVDILTNAQISRIYNATRFGDVDFQITRCAETKDDPFEDCTPLKIGDKPGKCEDGILKDFGDLEPDWATTVYFNDDEYRDCSSGKPRVGYFYGPFDYPTPGSSNQGESVRLYTRLMDIGDNSDGVAKYKLCVRYSDKSCCPSAEECDIFISDQLKMDLDQNLTQQNYNFGDQVTFSVKDVKTTWDNISVPSTDLKKTCYLSTHSYFQNPSSILSGPTVTLRTIPSSSNSASFYIYYSTPLGYAPNPHRIRADVTIPPTCKFKDTGGLGSSIIHMEGCGAYSGLDDEHKTVYCCGKNWTEVPSSLGYAASECHSLKVNQDDDIEVEMLVNTSETDSNKRYTYSYVYYSCPAGTEFGDPNEEYEVSIQNANNLYVNDYDVPGVSFDSPLPGKMYTSSSDGDLECTDIPLNFCGKARIYLRLDDIARSYALTGIKYAKSDYGLVCIGGPSCPANICS